MTPSKTQSSDENIALKRLVDLYPLAFAMASASGFRTGLALLREERLWLARPIDPDSRSNPIAGNIPGHPQQGYTP